MSWTHAPTFNKWHKKKKKNKNKKTTLHMLTRGTNVRVWFDFLGVCIIDKFCDTREKNVTIRDEI
jgi:hypothetical protein